MSVVCAEGMYVILKGLKQEIYIHYMLSTDIFIGLQQKLHCKFKKDGNIIKIKHEKTGKNMINNQDYIIFNP